MGTTMVRMWSSFFMFYFIFFIYVYKRREESHFCYSDFIYDPLLRIFCSIINNILLFFEKIKLTHWSTFALQRYRWKKPIICSAERSRKWVKRLVEFFKHIRNVHSKFNPIHSLFIKLHFFSGCTVWRTLPVGDCATDEILKFSLVNDRSADSEQRFSSDVIYIFILSRKAIFCGSCS